MKEMVDKFKDLRALEGLKHKTCNMISTMVCILPFFFVFLSKFQFLPNSWSFSSFGPNRFMSLKHKTSFFCFPIKVFIFTQFLVLFFFLTEHFFCHSSIIVFKFLCLSSLRFLVFLFIFWLLLLFISSSSFLLCSFSFLTNLTFVHTLHVSCYYHWR